MKRPAIMLTVVLAVVCPASALTIVPHFLNGAGATWTQTRKDIVYQAIEDWESVILDAGHVDVDMTFETGSFLGQWSASGSFHVGTDIYPWTSGLEHTIALNAPDVTDGDLWFDSTPYESSDLSYWIWDALSVIRHEMGHMLGFAEGMYVDNFSQASERDRWSEYVVGSYFDPEGLNVRLASSSNVAHVYDGEATQDDLMVSALSNGQRRRISNIDLQMLELAHGYEVVLTAPPGGDINWDLRVDVVDLGILAANWGMASARWQDGDFDGNQVVDVVDLGIMATNWGYDGTAGVPVPEPTNAVLLAAAGLGMLARRRA